MEDTKTKFLHTPQFRAVIVIALTSFGVKQSPELWVDIVIVAFTAIGGYADWWFSRLLACLRRNTPPETSYENSVGRDVTADGAQRWYHEGQLHREEAPAVIHPDGSEEWHHHGKLHREGAPAVIWADGTQEWWLDGKLHREGGPAYVFPDGTGHYQIHGEHVPEPTTGTEGE